MMILVFLMYAALVGMIISQFVYDSTTATLWFLAAIIVLFLLARHYYRKGR